jgi:hypothetical protein
MVRVYPYLPLTHVLETVCNTRESARHDQYRVWAEVDLDEHL